MSLIRKHGAVLQAWACLDLVFIGFMGQCKSQELSIIADWLAARRGIFYCITQARLARRRSV